MLCQDEDFYASMSALISTAETIRAKLDQLATLQDTREINSSGWKFLGKAMCVYKIPCKNCEKSYVGETGRSLGIRMEEHWKEAERSESRPYKRFSKSMAASGIHKSAITDHVVMHNHLMD